jgi:hypothetical protein
VRLAFDADALDNAHVARGLADCCEAATAAGLAVELERWNRADGKGIDDLLAAGKVPELLAGGAALAAVREGQTAATAGEMPPRTNGLERLGEVLAAGGPRALFSDQELLKALARLKAEDPAAFASHRATLKGLVSLADLDNALKPLVRGQVRERPPMVLEDAGYRIDAGRICRERVTPEGGVALVPLCNFMARISEVVTRDDGAEQAALFTLVGTLAEGRELSPVSVPATDFAGLGWVTTEWHGDAVVYAGQGTRDHLRAAIELLSRDRQRRTLYTHSGWRRVGGSWIYLHGAGAVGPVGPVAEIEVCLPDSLGGFVLPRPPEGEALAAAVRASFALLDGLVADRLAFPLLGAVYRAALGEAPGPIDLSLYLAGPHGVGKSELAALAQQHFGAFLDARHLPGSWSSTGNALEGLAFAAKDALFAVDDYAPRGAVSDRQRLERDADRLLRAQGNRSGRQRMRPDASQRPPKPPRGLILSTGEDVPPGQSLRGRMLVLEISPGDVPLSRLTPYQHAAAAGLNAQAMAGFIHWLAPRYGELCRELPDERSALREQAMTGTGSSRTPGIIADLALGLRYVLRFAAEIGAITSEERDTLERRGWAALVEAAAAHTSHVQSAEPAQLFVRLLVDAIASGRAYISAPDGAEPSNPSAWGWRHVTIGSGDSEREEWKPQGRCVGWLEGSNDLYLLPHAAIVEAQALAAQEGEGLPVSARTLWRRLRECNMLASWDEARQRCTVRRRLQGQDRREVLHLRADTLFTLERPSPPSPDGAPQHQQAGEPGDGRGDGCTANTPDRPHDRPQVDADGRLRNGLGDGRGDGQGC